MTVIRTLLRAFGINSKAEVDLGTRLSRLGDRELADIGLTRGLIPQVIINGQDATRHISDDPFLSAANRNRRARAKVAA